MLPQFFSFGLFYVIVHVAFVVYGHAQVLICVGVFQWLVSYCYFCIWGFSVEDHRLTFFLSKLDVVSVCQVIVLLCRGGLGPHRPSTVSILILCCSIVFGFQYLGRVVPSLYHLLDLHIQ